MDLDLQRTTHYMEELRELGEKLRPEARRRLLGESTVHAYRLG